MVMSASGVVSNLLHLFDISYPKYSPGCSDSDLGSPNKACHLSGPGIGSCRAPGEPSENCDSHGNVLIIKEDNDGSNCPNENCSGGTIAFDFVNRIS